jgi:hypothetical protein
MIFALSIATAAGIFVGWGGACPATVTDTIATVIACTLIEARRR